MVMDADGCCLGVIVIKGVYLLWVWHKSKQSTLLARDLKISNNSRLHKYAFTDRN